MAKTTIPGGYIEAGSIDTASLANTSITADKLHTTLDLTGKSVTVATATAGDNDTTVASTAFVSTAIANLADSAPATLDTLNELAAALGDDANFSTTVTNSIALKAPLASPAFTGTVDMGTFGNRTRAFEAYGSNVLFDGGSDSMELIVGDGSIAYMSIQTTDTASAMKIRDFTGNADLVTIQRSSGNVGIGTIDPGEKLSILGGHISVGDSTGVAGTEFLLEGYREIYNGAKYGNTSIRTTYDTGSNASDMLFYTASGGTNTAEAMRIDSSGNVGIGTGSDGADYQLHIAGGGDLLVEDTGNGSAHIRLRSSNSGTSSSDWKLKTGNNNYFYIDNDTGSATAIAIDNSGNVGIGITNPSTRTHIYSSASSTPLIVESTANTYVGIKNTTQTAYIGAVTSNMYFENNGAERMRIDSSGNVGIGDTDPPSLLTVTGTNTGFVTSNGAGISGIQVSRTESSGENLYMYTSSGAGWSGSSYVGRVQSYGNNAMEIGTPDNAPVSFATNNTERLRIHQEGYLEIPKYSSNADNTDTDTHRKIEFFANGSGQAIYKRDCFVQRTTGNTQYHWYKIFIASDAYARGVNIKYAVNWSTEHASGQGFVDGSLITKSNHGTSQVGVHGHIVYSRQYIGGSYYAWTDNPDVTIYHSSASGTSAGLYMRIEGYRASGYDGGAVHAIYLEIFGSEQDISNQGIYYTGSSTPSDIGAAVSRTILS